MKKFIITVLKLKAALIIILISLLVNSCNTGERRFETPVGERPGNQTGPFEILGVISKNTSSLSRANASAFFEEDVAVDIPPGTEIIIPAVRGWSTGYGRTEPEDLSDLSQPGLSWHPADHHLGWTSFNVFVKDINAVNNSTTPATQTATITISLYLSDDNSDDRWWGMINYTLICLGRKI